MKDIFPIAFVVLALVGVIFYQKPLLRAYKNKERPRKVALKAAVAALPLTIVFGPIMAAVKMFHGDSDMRMLMLLFFLPLVFFLVAWYTVWASFGRLEMYELAHEPIEETKMTIEKSPDSKYVLIAVIGAIALSLSIISLVSR